MRNATVLQDESQVMWSVSLCQPALGNAAKPWTNSRCFVLDVPIRSPDHEHAKAAATVIRPAVVPECV